MDLARIKKMGTIVLACALGMVIVQLAAPLILGVLAQGAALLVPLAVYHFFIKGKWRFRLLQEDEDTHGGTEGGHGTGGKAGREDSSDEDLGFFEDFEFPREEETVRQERETQEDGTYSWYEEQGRDRILGIVERLSLRGIFECWVRKDGICNIRTEKGYRRTGTLPGFSQAHEKTLIGLLGKEGIAAERHGRYLYLTWKNVRREKEVWYGKGNRREEA